MNRRPCMIQILLVMAVILLVGMICYNSEPMFD